MSSSRAMYANTVSSKTYANAVESIRRSPAFQKFFAKAIENINDFDSEQAWARQSTLDFRRKCKVDIRFPTVYFAFMNEAEKHQAGYDSESVGDDANSVDSNETYERDGFVVNDDEVEHESDVASEEEWEEDDASCESESIASQSEAEDEEPKRTSRVVQSSSNAAFVEDKEQTRAESNKGQHMLHKIIMKEYNTWYQAFQEEADEDTEEDAMTADERFQWHCAKVLSRKTDIRAKEIYPVVGAWLHEHHKA